MVPTDNMGVASIAGTADINTDAASAIVEIRRWPKQAMSTIGGLSTVKCEWRQWE